MRKKEKFTKSFHQKFMLQSVRGITYKIITTEILLISAIKDVYGDSFVNWARKSRILILMLKKCQQKLFIRRRKNAYCRKKVKLWIRKLACDFKNSDYFQFRCEKQNLMKHLWISHRDAKLFLIIAQLFQSTWNVSQFVKSRIKGNLSCPNSRKKDGTETHR